MRVTVTRMVVRMVVLVLVLVRTTGAVVLVVTLDVASGGVAHLAKVAFSVDRPKAFCPRCSRESCLPAARASSECSSESGDEHASSGP